jgi:hypothetical protein
MEYYNQETRDYIVSIIDRTEAINYNIAEFKSFVYSRLKNNPNLLNNYIQSVKNKATELEDMLVKLGSTSFCNRKTKNLIFDTYLAALAAIDDAKKFNEIEEDPK